MIEPRDEELSGIYRDAEGPRPPQRVDDNILAASQRVAGARPRPAGAGFARRWGTPVALAATMLVTATLTLMVFERESALETKAPEAPRADRLAKISPSEPKRADQAATSSVAELQAAAPETAIRQAAARRDQTEQGPGESAAASERLGTAQPALVPEVPRTSEVLRKSEEAKPAPAAAPAANLYSGERALADQPAPAAASAAGALRGPTSTPQSVEVIGGLSRSLADAKERTPEKWLEDIRQLKINGKTTEAERELAEFKKRYPDYRLPEDLR
ncbi:MAG TPA: hypothetical protein VIW78_09825 [Burkholderiales bacterium]